MIIAQREQLTLAKSEVTVGRLEIERLKLMLAKARREQFGQSSERGKLLVEQLELAIEAEIADGRMPAGSVKSFDVVEHIGACLISGSIDLGGRTLGLERGEEALHRRVVPDVAGAAHAANDAVVGHQALELFAGVLAALVWNDATAHPACRAARRPSTMRPSRAVPSWRHSSTSRPRGVRTGRSPLRHRASLRPSRGR